jgi:hypothetical protein
MRKHWITALALLFLAGAWQTGIAQEKAADARTLKVKLNYTGAGPVDEKHKIYLFLFDSPDFVKSHDVMPIGGENATAKDATVTFSAVGASPVYLVAVYDPTGGYEGMSEPPSGASLGMYSTTPGQPGPIAIDAGKTTKIDLPFDDSFKMP